MDNFEGGDTIYVSVGDKGKLSFEKKELVNDMKMALEDLNKNYKEILVLKYFEDMSVKQIAEMKNKSFSSVESQLYKARMALKKKMAVAT